MMKAFKKRAIVPIIVAKKDVFNTSSCLYDLSMENLKMASCIAKDEIGYSNWLIEVNNSAIPYCSVLKNLVYKGKRRLRTILERTVLIANIIVFDNSVLYFPILI